MLNEHDLLTRCLHESMQVAFKHKCNTMMLLSLLMLTFWVLSVANKTDVNLERKCQKTMLGAALHEPIVSPD